MVKGFEFVKLRVTGPLPVVVTLPLIVNWFAATEIPDAPVVARAPLKVARPAMLGAEIEAALIALAVRSVAAVIVRALSGVVFPKAPVN